MGIGNVEGNTAENQAMAIANQLIQEEPAIETGKPTVEATVAADATNAHRAAEVAKQAAKVATKVANHSVVITEHAKSALQNAHDALHRARVDTKGLSVDQTQSLKEAESKLRKATKDAEY